MNLGHSSRYPSWARHLTLMLGVTLLLLFALDQSIDAYTRHGQVVKMPELKGVDAGLAMQQLSALGLNGVVSDTLFVDGAVPGSVCEQSPGPDSEVKEGRTVYLTVVSAEVPMVRLPNLVDVSLRKAGMDLNRLGLKTGNITTRPDIAHNVVLEVRLHGRPVSAGTLLPKGSSLDLEVGISVPDSMIMVPEIRGLTLEEARLLLHENGLFLGAVNEEAAISPAGRALIVRQWPEPNPDELIRTLSPVDVWIAPE
jgi:beta-lactam-binding protein with PASTA domain